MPRARGRDTKSGRTRHAPAPKRQGRGRRRALVGLAALLLAVGVLVTWRRGLLTRPDRGAPAGAMGLAPEEANRVGLELGGKGRHLEAIPYFRSVVRQDPRWGYAHENLGSALGNGAQQSRTMLGKADNAVRSSVERIAMLKESITETILAERLAANANDRVLALLERGRALETWGFPLDALTQFRTALAIAPQRADAVTAARRIERELATGQR